MRKNLVINYFKKGGYDVDLFTLWILQNGSNGSNGNSGEIRGSVELCGIFAETIVGPIVVEEVMT